MSGMTHEDFNHDPAPTIGLIAGQGQLPLLVAAGARAAGLRICCVGLRGQFDARLPERCDDFRSCGFARIGSWIHALRTWDVHDAIMVGGVRKTRMHDPFRLIRQIPDLRAARLWYRHLRHDRRNAAVLAAVADELGRSGITLINSTTYIQNHLASTGVMTRTQPTAQQLADVAFGWPLLSQTVELHIGQSIAVRDRDVIAVEAVEGTDAMIARAGTLCRSRGWTLLKTASRDHDMRADVPTIGINTIEQLKAAGGRCIAMGAGCVILVDREAVIAAADAAGIAIVGMEPAPRNTTLSHE
ncbi:MAG: LpxI family protein [Phycisphaerales bacterium]